MIPIILGAIGTGLLIDAYSGKKFSKGGKVDKEVVIQPSGRGEMQIWHVIEAQEPYSYATDMFFDNKEQAVKYAKNKGFKIVDKFHSKFAKGGEIDSIINYVKDNSYFDYEEDEDEQEVLKFSTRKNGDVLNEIPSSIDIKEGKKLKMEILEKFKNVDVKLEVVDEWVLIFVTNKKENPIEYRYVFKKDWNGKGFSESFDSMEELIKRFGSWIDVDWDAIKNKINNIDKYPNNGLDDFMSSDSILISKADEKGNDWGYNFYIIKQKKK